MDYLTLALMALPALRGLGTDVGRLFGSQSDEPGFMEGLFGRSGRVVDPLGPQGQQIMSLLAQRLAQQSDIQAQAPFQQAMGGLQSLLSGDTLSTMMAPAMRMFREQLVPQTASQAMGQGMSRGRSALPAYLTQATERMGQQALAQQAGLVPQAIEGLFGAAQAPFRATTGAMQGLAGARGGLMQGQPMPGALGAIGSSPQALSSLRSLLGGS